MPLLIKNAVLADHISERKQDIFINNGVISETSENLSRDCETIDAKGLYVMPAFVDLHCHLRYPGLTHKEDIESGCRAAVRGGYTTLNAMANTKPVCSSLETARDVAEKAAELGLCDVYQSISLTDDFAGKSAEHLKCLSDDSEKNVVKFVSEDGFGVENSLVFLTGIQACAKYGRIVLVHAEDRHISDYSMYAAEDLETIRDIYLAGLEKNTHVHFCHVSTEYSARAITKAINEGAKLSFEVTPHHLALNDETNYRVNPPLRKESDRQYLIEAIRRGDVCAIATDHAPHTAEDKQNGAPGMSGLETAFSVCYTTLVRDEGIPLTTLSRLMSKNPALMMSINKGELTPGCIGDIVIVDLNKKRVINSGDFLSKGKNTPFDGKSYYGTIVHTIKNGRVIM